MKSMLKYVSAAAHIFVVALILIGLVHCLQGITIESAKLFVRKPERIQRQSDPARRSFVFLPDGTLHQIRTISDANDLAGRSIEEVYDANNTLVIRRHSSKEPDQTYLSFPFPLNTPSLDDRYMIEPAFSSTLDMPVFENATLQEIWRYDRVGQVFVGHDRKGAALGYLDAQGLQLKRLDTTGLGDLKRFFPWWTPERDRVKTLWLTRHALYEIDVKARRVERLVDANDSALVSLSAQAWYDIDKKERGYVDPNLYRPLIVCRSMDQRYHLVLRDPEQTISFAPSEEWTQWTNNYCQFSATKTDLFMSRYWVEFPAYPQGSFDTEAQNEWLQEYRATKKHHGTELYQMDTKGNLEIVSRGGWRETLADTGLRSFDGSAWNVHRVVRCASPALYSWVVGIVGPKALLTRVRMTERNTPAHLHTRMLFWGCPAGPWDYIPLSLTIAGFVFLHGRSRFPTRRRLIFWLAFVFTFNLAGLLTYLALNHSMLIRCEACGQKRGIEQDACPRCAAPLPVPTPSAAHLIMS